MWSCAWRTCKSLKRSAQRRAAAWVQVQRLPLGLLQSASGCHVLAAAAAASSRNSSNRSSTFLAVVVAVLQLESAAGNE